MGDCVNVTHILIDFFQEMTCAHKSPTYSVTYPMRMAVEREFNIPGDVIQGKQQREIKPFTELFALALEASQIGGIVLWMFALTFRRHLNPGYPLSSCVALESSRKFNFARLLSRIALPHKFISGLCLRQPQGFSAETHRLDTAAVRTI